MSNDKYILDNKSPFSVTGESGKLPDGKVRESAFVKFRSTGVLTTSVDGPTFICLFAGAGNVIAWKSAGAGGNAIHPAYGTWLPPLFNGHTASPAFGQVKHFRTTSVGLQLESVQDDDSIGGYFEAVRFPESDVGNGFVANVSTAGEVFPTLLVGLDQYDMGNHSSYIKGTLEDLSKITFKLNVKDNNVPFNLVKSTMLHADYLTSGFDFILIKLNVFDKNGGSKKVKYDCVSNQEIVYKQGSIYSKLMSTSVAMNDYEVTMDRLKWEKPGYQINN